MRNFWFLARTEYWKMVKRRGFIIGTAGIPLFLLLIMGVSIVFAISDISNQPVGYIDQSGILAAALYPAAAEEERRRVNRTAYAELQSQRDTLDAQIKVLEGKIARAEKRADNNFEMEMAALDTRNRSITDTSKQRAEQRAAEYRRLRRGYVNFARYDKGKSDIIAERPSVTLLSMLISPSLDLWSKSTSKS